MCAPSCCLPTDQARLRAYHDRLVETVAKAPNKVSLAALMPPLFRTVLERGAGGDVAAENRAAIVVLAFYANGTGLAAIAPAAAQWPQAARRTVTLAGRDDFPKHFLISAAIAAEAGSPLADAVGLYKEVDDSRGGSGFSFNDIGADRAGTRFGEIASQSPERARKLAQALASGVKESDFMPDVADLPEFMPEAEFKRRYGGIGGPGYNKHDGHDRGARCVTTAASLEAAAAAPFPKAIDAADFATRNRFPAMYGLREFVESDALLSYGESNGGVTRAIKPITAVHPMDLMSEIFTSYQLATPCQQGRLKEPEDCKDGVWYWGRDSCGSMRLHCSLQRAMAPRPRRALLGRFRQRVRGLHRLLRSNLLAELCRPTSAAVNTHGAFESSAIGNRIILATDCQSRPE